MVEQIKIIIEIFKIGRLIRNLMSKGGTFLNFLKRISERIKDDNLARKRFEAFKSLVDRFNEILEIHLDSSKYISILYILDHLLNNEDFEGRIIKDLNEKLNLDKSNIIKYIWSPFKSEISICINNLPSHITHIWECFKERVDSSNKTYNDFRLLVKEFNWLLRIYNELCICMPVERIRKEIGKENVPEETKEKYRQWKEEYNRFLGKYKDFGKEMNVEFKEKLFITEFKRPEEL